jgi:hypothetical protein
MASSSEPMIKLEPDGKASVLSYNVPDPTSYSGRNFIELTFDEDDEVVFKPVAFKKPQTRTSVTNLEINAIKSAVSAGMKSGFSNKQLFPNIKLSNQIVCYRESSETEHVVAGTQPVSPTLAGLTPDDVAVAMKAGMRLNIYKSLYGTLTYNLIPEPTTVNPRIFIIESYRLSSFLGSYGAGRTVKTFSLLPGEKTRISVKTYTKTESESKNSSSILDSFTQESADAFETSVQEELSDKTSSSENFEYHAEAEASASWGWGKAQVSGGIRGASSSTREEFAKNISNALQKHSAQASAKRDVQINTSYEVKEEKGEETAIERDIQNINLSRTLNFVFRQMNQEYISLLTLTDIRIGFFNGFAESKIEVPLSQCDTLLQTVISDAKRVEVRQAILNQIRTITDYLDERHDIIEEVKLSEGDSYLRIKKNLTHSYRDTITGIAITVPGIIMRADKNILRTEGVIVEALLGQGVALDEYATQLQSLEVKKREAEVARLSTLAAQDDLICRVTKDNDKDRAQVLSSLIRSSGTEAPCLKVSVENPAKEKTP